MKKNGFKHICLWVLKDNIRARKFYEKNGFQISGNVREIEMAECRIPDNRKQALLAKTFLGKIVLSVSLSSFEKDSLDVFQPTIYLKNAMI